MLTSLRPRPPFLQSPRRSHGVVAAGFSPRGGRVVVAAGWFMSLDQPRWDGPGRRRERHGTLRKADHGARPHGLPEPREPAEMPRVARRGAGGFLDLHGIQHPVPKDQQVDLFLILVAVIGEGRGLSLIH